MSLVGIRDMSVLEEPPVDRVPIQTYVMEYNDEMVREAVNRELARGGQVYYVYNRVKDIEEVAHHVQELVPDATVVYAHGQMPEHRLEQILLDFVKQFYAGTPFVPRELILQKEIDDIPVLEEWLTARRGARVYIRVPRKGQKEKLVELAEKNAKLVLEKDRERIARDEARTVGAVRQIAQLLDLPMLDRMEAFDISNISGFENVGSMVVYEKGKPKRSDYRKFKIKTVAGPDDYACMREVLTRRFEHGLKETKELEEKNLSGEFGSFARFPDLLLMDGGRGQVNIAQQVLDELHLNIPVCGMVKDDNHRTRGLYFHNVELPIDRNSEAFKLITRVQDEAHRFAIEYHRSLRSKDQVKSVLDEIPGVGPARRKALMKSFPSIYEIRDATAEQIAMQADLPMSVAEEIYEFFHNHQEEDCRE